MLPSQFVRALRSALSFLLVGLMGGCFLIGYDGISDIPDALPKIDGPGGDASTHDAAGPDQGLLDGGNAGVDARPRDASEMMTLDDAEASRDAAQAPDAEAPRDAGKDSVDAGEGKDAGGDDPDAGTGISDAGGGAPDAGTSISDAGGGTPDAGTGIPDAGGDPGDDPWWENVPPILPCQSTYACSQSCTSTLSPCVFECDAWSCLPSCQANTQCHATCGSGASCVGNCGAGAECVQVCRGVQCSTTCTAGSNCDLDCGGAASCVLTCEQGARCLARCGSALDCEMNCKGVQMSCANGTIACDRACP